MGPGVTGRHPPRHQRDDQLVEPPKTALMFRDQLRFERGVAISGHLHAHRAGICLDRLGIRAVTVVTRTPPGWVALLIAQMVSHLHLQAPRQNPRRQLGQHPLRAQKLQTLRVDLSHQTIHQLIIDHRPPGSSIISLSVVVIVGVLSAEPTGPALPLRHLTQSIQHPRLRDGSARRSGSDVRGQAR